MPLLNSLDQLSLKPKENASRCNVGDFLVCEGGDIWRTTTWNGELARCFYQNYLHCAHVAFNRFFRTLLYQLMTGQLRGHAFD